MVIRGLPIHGPRQSPQERELPLPWRETQGRTSTGHPPSHSCPLVISDEFGFGEKQQVRRSEEGTALSWRFAEKRPSEIGLWLVVII